MRTRLDISIGPVQGFVAQSRRTRDLWSSSYLLSFLAGHAMHGAQSAGGIVIKPSVDEDLLYQWVSGNQAKDAPVPKLGSLPNHFVVEVDTTASQVATAAQEGMSKAW
ncbi:MAG: type III-B CRISPR-associated protein Cas10/Cmr2, partial [Chloroflexi bacterium]|nr:type III-B CRISPR-associated protein Cas10/Cmr2 [Chloroflexota bacterium]